MAAAVAGFFYARVDERFQGFEGTEQFVEITPGTGSRAIGRRWRRLAWFATSRRSAWRST